MCKFNSSQEDENRVQFTDSSKAYIKPTYSVLDKLCSFHTYWPYTMQIWCTWFVYCVISSLYRYTLARSSYITSFYKISMLGFGYWRNDWMWWKWCGSFNSC